MFVRQLTVQDMPEFARLRSIAFLRAPDHDPIAHDIHAGEMLAGLSWGCFADDGPMMACLTNNSYHIHYDGRIVRMGGVGGVATLPEYRHGGAVRALFAAMLRQAREKGEVFSTLYPFSHAYYRQFGYDLCHSPATHVYPASALSGHRFSGWARLMLPGESLDVLVPIYEQFAARYNLSAANRDARATARLMKGDPYQNQSFTYLLGEDGDAFAYAHFSVLSLDGRMTLAVEDYAFTAPTGWQALLGFFSRFAANCQAVRINLPEDVPMAHLLDNPYDDAITVRNRLMARIVHVPAALALLRRPEGCCFTVAVTDSFLPENDGVYQVTDAGVLPVEGIADLAVDIGTLTQLCLGYLDLRGALFKPGVRLNGHEEILTRIFVRKLLYLADYY